MTYLAFINVAAMIATVAAMTRLVVTRADRDTYGRVALLLLGSMLLMGLAGLTRRLGLTWQDDMAALTWTVVTATALTVATWRLTPHD